MTDQPKSGVPFEPADSAEAGLWRALNELPGAEPSPRLRAGFYRRLERAGRPGRLQGLRDRLGFSCDAGWVTAAACLVVGVLVGRSLLPPPGSDQDAVEALQVQVAMLNRSLILDRLESQSPGKRLRGVVDAAGVVGADGEVTRALLRRAADDRVPSVRSAAIDALGPVLMTPSIGDELMGLLRSAESPLVQLALVDLVLRHGSPTQLRQLIRYAEDGLLHPDLVDYVLNSVVRNRA